MTLIDEIKRDREAGTPGPWGLVNVPLINRRMHQKVGPFLLKTEVSIEDARRIARVPDMEAALIAAKDLLARAVELLEHVEDPDIERASPQQCTVCRSYRLPLHEAIHAYRAATGGAS